MQRSPFRRAGSLWPLHPKCRVYRRKPRLFLFPHSPLSTSLEVSLTIPHLFSNLRMTLPPGPIDMTRSAELPQHTRGQDRRLPINRSDRMIAGSFKVTSLAVLALISVLPASAQSAGIINTVVGNGYQGRFGMGGPANAAELTSPNSVAIDKKGNLFIADTASEHIYRVDASSGNISVFAGSGAGGYSGDGGPAKDASFNHPFGLAFNK